MKVGILSYLELSIKTDDAVQGPQYREFSLLPGKQYLVVGLTFAARPNSRETEWRAELEDEQGNLIRVPLLLLEIVDPRSSGMWEARKWSNGTFTLWPAPLYEQYFHDDLFEAVSHVVEKFAAVRSALEHEFPPLPGAAMTAAEKEALSRFLREYWPSGPPIDDAMDKEIVQHLLDRSSAEERRDLTRLLRRFLGSPEPLPTREDLVRQSAWKYLPDRPGVAAAWIGTLVARLEGGLSNDGNTPIYR